MKACNRGDSKIVDALLAHPNIDPNIQIENDSLGEAGQTAIVFAAKCGHVEIVSKLLMHHKINTGLLDARGNTIFSLVQKFLLSDEEQQTICKLIGRATHS